jgi:hypothetical protein
VPSIEDEGEVGALKKKYGSKIAVIKEMFPDWSEVDILYAMQECDGDESIAVTRIAEGTFVFLLLRMRLFAWQDFHIQLLLASGTSRAPELQQGQCRPRQLPLRKVS